jgi:hypothetical protein
VTHPIGANYGVNILGIIMLCGYGHHHQ